MPLKRFYSTAMTLLPPKHRRSNMKKLMLSLVIVIVMAGMAQAVPTLQVGAPGSTPGTYAPYQTTLTNPPETDTAVTGGNTLYVAGAYAVQPELLLGGQYAGPPVGKNWSDFGYA